MLGIIDWVLHNCGSSLEKALKSKRFATLLNKESQIASSDKDSDEGVALRTGLLTMAPLLNSLPDGQAVERAKVINGSEKPTTEERVLIRICGEQIVKAAGKCLSENVVQMAKRFKVAEADEQFEIVRQLFFEFRSGGQDAKGELTMDSVREKLQERERKRLMDEYGFLPGLYKEWNRESCPANCQGKTQMLVAFAKLAKAQVMVIHPIKQAKELTTQRRRELKKLVADDITARVLLDGSQEFRNSLEASYYDDVIRDKDNECFHVGVVIKLRDGRWIMIDPHGLSWGLIPEGWKLDSVRKTLKKYSGVLPGLTITAQDEQVGSSLVDDIMSKATDLIHRSRKMGEKIKSEVETVMDLIDVVCESDDFDLLMRVNCEQTGEKILDLSTPEIRKYAAMIVVLGGQETLFDFSAMMDPSLLKRRTESWLTFYHACAMNMFLNRETDEGKIVHPICEVAAVSEWTIAISAINSATWRCGHGRDEETEKFFVRNSFDQTTLYNAAGLINEPVGAAAQETLKSLKYLHPMCEKKIKSLEAIRRVYGL